MADPFASGIGAAPGASAGWNVAAIQTLAALSPSYPLFSVSFSPLGLAPDKATEIAAPATESGGDQEIVFLPLRDAPQPPMSRGIWRGNAVLAPETPATHANLPAFADELARMNGGLAGYDRAAGMKRRGETPSADEQAALDDPALRALDAERAAYVKAHYREHALATADIPGNPTRAHLDAHLGAIDLGSYVELGDGAVFRDGSQVIRFSEALLARAYRGELAPGTEIDVSVENAGQMVKGRARVFTTGELADGVDVGPSSTGGRLVIGITFERAIGREGTIALPEGQSSLAVTRTTGGRQETVRVIDGEKQPTFTMYIVGGPYGPSGTFGIFTVFPGVYAPPVSNAAYWEHHAFLTGEASASFREGADGSLVVRSGSNLDRMAAEQKLSFLAPQVQGVPSLDAADASAVADTGAATTAREAFSVDAATATFGDGYFGSHIGIAPETVADLMAALPRTQGQTLFKKDAGDLHVTVIGPADVNELIRRRVESQPTSSKSAARKQIEAELGALPSPGGRPLVTGIGSATDAAGGHTVFFATVEWAEAQRLRASLGLPPKDLHITLASTAESKPGSGTPKDVHGIPKQPNLVAFGTPAPMPAETETAQASSAASSTTPASAQGPAHPLDLEGEFGTRVQRVIGALFRSGLGYLHGRLGINPAPGMDAADAGLAAFFSDTAEGSAQTAARIAGVLAASSGNPAVRAGLAMRLLASPNAAAIVEALARAETVDGTSALEDLFPELAGKRIAQDTTYHHGETVLDHSVASLRVVEELIAGRSQLARYRRLMRLVALFHDVGKHDDPQGPRLGRREADAATGKVRFLGHAELGAKLFEEMVRTRLNPNLPAELRLTEQEIALGRHLIDRHMDGIGLTAVVGQVTPRAVNHYLARLGFENQDLLRMGIPVEDILEASLVINEMDIRAAQGYAGKEDKVGRFLGIAATLRAALSEIKQRLILQSIDPLVGGDDLQSLGAPKGPYMGAILDEIRRLQAEGSVLNRAQALQRLAELAAGVYDLIVPEGWIEERLAAPGKYGASLGTNVGAERTLVDTDGRPIATVRLFRTMARAQFPGGIHPETLVQVLRSGAYPTIEAAVDDGRLSVEGVQAALTERRFGNLPALEAFLQAGGDITQVGMGALAPTLPVVEIIRSSDGQRIVMEAGQQGSEEHDGSGAFHVGAQRLEQLARSFQKPGEILEDTLSRFLGYAIRIAATSRVEIPSNRDPNCFFLLGRMNGGRQYAAVLVDKADPSAWRIVTTVFASSPEEMRRAIAKYYLAQLKLRPQGREPLGDADFARVMAGVNGFLATEGLPAVTMDAIYGLNGADGRGRERIEAALAAKGYEGKEARKRMSEIEGRAETLAQALSAVGTLPDLRAKASTAPAKTALPMPAPEIIRLLQARGYVDGRSYGQKLAEIRRRVEAGELTTADDVRAAIAGMECFMRGLQ